MAFTDMNDVEQELGEEKPPDRNGNRTFMIIAGILGGIMVLALLCVAGLALFKYLPGQQAAQSANATNEARATANAFASSQTAVAPPATATKPPVVIPTNTIVPTNTPVIAIGPTKSPTLDVAMATIYAMRTQNAQSSSTPVVPTSQPTSSQPTPRPTTTALPNTGIAEEMGTPGLITAAFVLVVIIFLMRRLRTAF
jgi:hypothetical protein